MTDVYLAYAREDREGVRILAEMLQFEGWDVWMDPSDPTGETSAAVDMKLGSAGAILVLWSGYSRHSEYVRSEAATGLYKNKLIQAALDGQGAPRPYDSIDVIDLAGWTGERDHPQWRQIIEAVRLYAGAPGSARPLVQRRAVSGPPAYLEPRRQMAWGPIIAAGLLVSSGAGIWMADPFSWRATRTAVAAPIEAGADATLAAGESTEAAAIPRTYEDTEASLLAWDSVDRKSPDGLRDYTADFPNSTSAETARSLLRVLDAQAWVDAVTADNEGGYQSYLKKFPAEAALPGAMAAAATERLGSLRGERTQAIEEIQTGLATLGLYKGKVDGRSGDGTVRAVRQFASQNRRTAPALATAAPRDLRALAQAIQAVVSKRAGAPAVTVAAMPVPPPASVAATAAAEADRLRIAQAQAASQAAALAAAAPAARVDADTLAASQLQTIADADDWVAARQANTIASYQAYLAKNPSGAQAAAARTAIANLGKPVAFALDQVPAAVRAPIEAARRAQTTANTRASAARDAASQAGAAPGRTSIVATGGDRYDAQISGGAPNGLGTRISGNPTNSGDRYSGQLRNGESTGVGVYEFADNPGNAGAGALRYEGEHAGDAVSGHGVTYWRNGDRFAGEARADGSSRGVLTFSNGQRYEGELRDGNRDGFGVVWSADGTIVMAGRWANGELVEPAADQ
jgi:hypothetical protein